MFISKVFLKLFLKMSRFECVASGTISQANPRFSETRNVQCVCISVATFCFIENVRRDYLTTQDIDRLIVQGDCYYKQTKRTLGENHRHAFLTVNEVAEYLKLESQTFKIESHFEDYGVYPSSDNDLGSCTEELKEKLTNLFENYADSGFVFIGLHVAVSLWKCNSRYFIFDSHAVNENGTLSSDGVGRLFAFSNLKEMARFLMKRSPFNGLINQYEITRVVATRGQEPQCSTKRPIPLELKSDPKFKARISVVLEDIGGLDITELSKDKTAPKRKAGRPPKRPRGRPKTSSSSTRDQHREAVQRYTESHPEVHRKAVEKYTQTHPEVNRKAVEKYTQEHLRYTERLSKITRKNILR